MKSVPYLLVRNGKGVETRMPFRTKTIGGEMKLCKDCKWFALNTEEWESKALQSKYATCARTAFVDGTDGRECRRERVGGVFSATCGRSGRYWEPK